MKCAFDGIVWALAVPWLLTAALAQRQPTAAEKKAQAAPPTVLFVCEHGAAKSVIAAAEFNRLAQERGLLWRATFRGSNPEPSIAPAVAASLIRDGMKVQGQPSLVTAADVASAAQVITFANQLPVPTPSGKLQDWNDIPATSSDMSAAREAIRQRVIRLLDQLAAKRPSGTHGDRSPGWSLKLQTPLTF